MPRPKDRAKSPTISAVPALYGWRIAFLGLGIPGVFLVVVVKLPVREMARGSAEVAGHQTAAASDLIVPVARRIWLTPIYRRMALRGSLNTFVGYGLSMWMVDFYVRIYHAPLTQVGLWIALAFGGGGGIGTFVGGTVVNYLARTKVTSYLAIPGADLILSAPLMLLCILTSSMTLSVTCLFILSGLIYAPFGPVYGLVQTLAPVNNRSLAIAFFFFFQSMIGGPGSSFGWDRQRSTLEDLYAGTAAHSFPGGTRRAPSCRRTAPVPGKDPAQSRSDTSCLRLII